MAEQESFYVGIENPALVRRGILLSQKGMINCLKTHETFRDARRKKIEAISHLKHVIEEINSLRNDLRRALPQTGMRAVPESKNISKPQAASKKEPKLAPTVISRKAPDTLESLESELQEIERKLSQLG